MGHIPHVLLAGPWRGATIPLDETARHHLTRALRRADGDPVTYTDGAGRIGAGTYADGAVTRGDEREAARSASPVLAVAPPAQRDRVRFLVEKVAELGVPELWWLRTRYGEGRPPAIEKARAWCRSALEQSRSAWLMDVSDDLVSIDSLPPGTVFADRAGNSDGSLAHSPCVAIGPEGGWAEDEIPATARTVALAPGVLRVETAAITAAALANLV